MNALVAVLLLPQAVFFLIALIARVRRPVRVPGEPVKQVMIEVAAACAAEHTKEQVERWSEGLPDEGIVQLRLEEAMEDAITRYVHAAEPSPDEKLDEILANDMESNRPLYGGEGKPCD